MEKINKKELKGMLEKIKSKPELMARAEQLVTALASGNTEPADSIDADLKYTKGPHQNHRRRLSYFDRCDITNSDGERRVTISTRAPDLGPGAGIAFYDEHGEVRVGLLVTEQGQPGLQFYDQRGVKRMHIGLGKNGTPAILFFDEKGKETLVLSDEVIRFGRANEEQIQLEHKDSDVSLSISGGKRKGVAMIATVHGNPAMALVDSKNVNQVHIAPSAEDTSIGILRKGKYIWTAQPEHNSKKTKPAVEKRKP